MFSQDVGRSVREAGHRTVWRIVWWVREDDMLNFCVGKSHASIDAFQSCDPIVERMLGQTIIAIQGDKNEPR